MIYLTGGGTSNFTISTIQSNFINPKYIWILNEKGSKLTWTFSADNYSTSSYYATFTFSNMSGSATAGYIPLGSGEYSYSVYDSDIWSLTASSQIVDRGILVITSTHSNITKYSEASNSIIYTYKDF